MEADKPRTKSTRDSASETRNDAGTYVTPEILAAENGEQVEFGTTIEDRSTPTDEDRTED